MNFSYRAAGPELLDQPGIPAADIYQNMLELSIINKYLGGHSVTWKGFIGLIKQNKILVCEIGCGGGDNLKAIEKRAFRKQLELYLTGVDINEDCIKIAESSGWKNPVSFRVSDYRKVHFEIKPDIIFCSLFCHHFTEDELIRMFQWMDSNSYSGFFINDLHRHPLAYYSIRFLTSLFSNSYLVKNDAPLSVRRGFKKKELENILNKAGLFNFTIQWKWAFRWLVIVSK